MWENTISCGANDDSSRWLFYWKPSSSSGAFLDRRSLPASAILATNDFDNQYGSSTQRKIQRWLWCKILNVQQFRQNTSIGWQKPQLDANQLTKLSIWMPRVFTSAVHTLLTQTSEYLCSLNTINLKRSSFKYQYSSWQPMTAAACLDW